MGYPIYKLLRAVNRQYPNNGFINYVDVREDMYNGELIDEDLRDLINETIQEVYKDVAIDEVYSFPTVPGQNQYVLPEDCDLRDIQEVTRTFQGWRGPLCPPPGPPPLTPVYTLYFDNNGKVIRSDGTVYYLSGDGVMEPMECEIGEKITLPDCEFDPPDKYIFRCWEVNGVEYNPGDEIEMQGDFIATPIWTQVQFTLTLRNSTNDDKYIVIAARPTGGDEVQAQLYYNQVVGFTTDTTGYLDYEYITAYFDGRPFADFDVSERMTRDVFRNLAHPSVEPDGENSGSNGDGGYDNNPLEDLEVTPIDNGDGGYGDNPLDVEVVTPTISEVPARPSTATPHVTPDEISEEPIITPGDDDDEQTPATPSVTPDDENPLNP